MVFVRSFKPRLCGIFKFQFLCIHNKAEIIDNDLRQYMHGRKFSERRDSISKTILMERKRHQTKFETIDADERLVRSLSKDKLGSKKQMSVLYDQIASQRHTLGGVTRETNMAAGGFSEHVASASQDWPIFSHLLPEIVFAGHSNSGKSTLVNALSGVLPRKGPASTSERAGWTDQICFYQLGKKPPVLTLVDFPGYGHAIATADDRKEWIKMTRDYLANRIIISRCCILVDATRGLCAGDRSLMKYLNRLNIPWLIIMTKCDLLGPENLAKSIQIVREELVARELISTAINDDGNDDDSEDVDEENNGGSDSNSEDVAIVAKHNKEEQTFKLPIVNIREEFEEETADEPGLTYDDEDDYLKNTPQPVIVPQRVVKKVKKLVQPVKKDVQFIEDQKGVIIIPVSANTGAGVDNLWKMLKFIIEKDVDSSLMSFAVKEHLSADVLRRQERINRMLKTAKDYNVKLVKKAPKIKK